jgi:hypothetical protein
MLGWGLADSAKMAVGPQGQGRRGLSKGRHYPDRGSFTYSSQMRHPSPGLCSILSFGRLRCHPS